MAANESWHLSIQIKYDSNIRFNAVYGSAAILLSTDYIGTRISAAKIMKSNTKYKIMLL